MSGTIFVDDFGAVGDDQTDDTVAIQAAFDACAAYAAVVIGIPKLVFGSGKKYRTSDEMYCPTSILIDGQGAAIRSTVNDPVKVALRIGDTTTNTYRSQIKNLSITSVGASVSGGLHLERFLLSTLEDVYVSGFDKQLVLSSTSSDPFIGWLTIRKCYFQGGSYGIWGDGVPVNVTGISDCRFLQHSVVGIKMDQATSITVEGSDFSYCVGAVAIENGSNIRIIRNYTEKCGSGTENNNSVLVSLENCDRALVAENSLSGVNGTWRSRTHVAVGIDVRGCSNVRIVDNTASYFMDVAARFDENTGRGCEVARNGYTENFPDAAGFKMIDLSGRVRVDETCPVPKQKVSPIENLCLYPEKVAQGWDHGAQVIAEENSGAVTPFDFGGVAADKLTYVSGGADKASSIVVPEVVGGPDREFMLRFISNLVEVGNAAPLSGFAVLEVRVFDNTTLLKKQYVTLRKMWSFIEIPVTDENSLLHDVTVNIRPANTIYMEFSWSPFGVQYARAGTPYTL